MCGTVHGLFPARPRNTSQMTVKDFMTLQDGTPLRVGDKARARGEDGRLRICVVLEILRGGGVDKALLTAGKKYTGRVSDFGTVIRTRYQIKALKPGPGSGQKDGQ